MSATVRVIRRFAVLAALLGAVVLPSVDVSLSAGLLAAVLTLVVVSVAASAVLGVGALPHLRARAALERLAPRTAQSDPDARGHARPRAPGCLLTAV
jgi:hypothetical protein